MKKEKNIKCCCCCSAYLSSCHRTASDANLLDDPRTFYYNWRNWRNLRDWRNWRNPHMLRSFHRSYVPVDFFEFLSIGFAACTKPPKRDNHRKVSYPRTHSVTKVHIEPRSFDQGRRTNDAFTHSVTLQTNLGTLTF